MRIFGINAPRVCLAERISFARLDPVKVRDLRIIGNMPNGDRIVANTLSRVSDSSMVIFPGYILPPKDKYSAADFIGADEIMVKISPFESRDQHFALEQEFLLALSHEEGFPRVIAQGSVILMYREHEVAKKVEREAPFFVMLKLPGQNLPGNDVYYQSPDLFAQLVRVAFPALAERLATSHENNVVHRDVKPNNVLFDGRTGLLSLLDFGRANWLDFETPRTDHGAFGFYPPELHLEVPKREDVRTDVYGLGATCFSVLLSDDLILYGDMKNPWHNPEFRYEILGGRLFRVYYVAIEAHSGLSLDELVAQSNMPDIFKRTELGRYLHRLVHPLRDERPSDMREIAGNLRRYGREFPLPVVF